MDDYWAYLDALVAKHPIVIDRPAGSSHPRFPEMIYPLDYGYLEGSTTVDGGGVDVWVGSQSGRDLDAVILTVDLNKDDTEIKILLGCSEKEKQVILTFLNSYLMRAVLVRRGADGLENLHTRRSVRRFLEQPVPLDLIQKMLAAATWAPSPHNSQPWRFAVLTSPASKEHLADEMGAAFRRDLLADGLTAEDVEAQVKRSRDRIREAPAAILLCLDETAGQRYPDPGRQQKEFLMGAQSLAMAGENILLAAHAMGLGGVWMCAPLFVPQVVRQALELPQDWHPQGLLLIGYPSKWPERRPRRDVAEVARYY